MASTRVRDAEFNQQPTMRRRVPLATLPVDRAPNSEFPNDIKQRIYGRASAGQTHLVHASIAEAATAKIHCHQLH